MADLSDIFSNVNPLKETYTDSFRHTFDEKGRITVPSEWRTQSHEKRLLVIPSNEGCLKIYPSSFLGEKMKVLASAPLNDPRRKGLEKLASSVQSVEWDGQGRIMIKEKLRDGATLKKNVVLLGCFDHFEIWNAAEWDKKAKGETTLEDIFNQSGF